MENEKLTKWDLWLLAIRPKTLPAAVAPVLVGSAAAFSDGFFHPLLMLACLLGALLLQIAVNFANDYFDAKNNIDSAERLGPVRVTQSGLIPAAQVKWAMALALVLAVLVFSYLSSVAGWPIVMVMIASVLGALGYSGGPYPLASNGLGEIFVFIFFGLIAVCGTYFILAAQLVASAFLVAIPPGLLITAIMVINNLRDIDTDSRSGKKTLAVILGRSRTILEYRLLLLCAYLVPLVMFLTGTSYFILMPFFSLPLAIKLWGEVEHCLGTELNSTLAKTAKLSLMFSLGFAVGLVLGA
ncbi:1,4-dihydroxy-2-naphthoate polyprenyltransferase [Desulfotalea psychrophila]|uniref:1,4-dihydroxy-2-naphthoate octaprenyltransferase n=1 Tax=Desulfotalea psychrophila (strain LSv54 / DSM 12343) TaxID=177439 RepID=Q6APS3_DESPS|nr:1,4-dihydroxy-2-naphthoate polyprenyltransferase [Desulfotalea psychrophila]CAG35651.1 probable 1,4-dihydroxy-2-naphthoate octaprenyltransferase [Desulfotalea psychrophila LSv54]